MKNIPPALYGLALIGFFLPWASLSCSIPDPESGQTKNIKITQSGLQMITGGTSVTENGKAPSAAERAEMEQDKDGPSPAVVLAIFPIALVVGIGLCFSNLKGAGIAGFVAFGSAILQMAIGFPVHNVGPPGLAGDTLQGQSVTAVVYQPDGIDLGELGDLGELEDLDMEGFDDAMGEGMEAMMGQGMKKATEPFFWLSTLAALAGAILCMVAASQQSTAGSTIAAPVSAPPAAPMAESAPAAEEGGPGPPAAAEPTDDTA